MTKDVNQLQYEKKGHQDIKQPNQLSEKYSQHIFFFYFCPE